MGRVAVFLGAGASKSVDYPLTSDLLPIILRRLETRSLFCEAIDGRDEAVVRRFDGEGMDLLAKCLADLLPGWRSVPSEKLPWVTDLLSLVDHALAHEVVVLPRLPKADWARVPWTIAHAIYRAIEFDDQGKPRRGNLTVMKSFVRWLIDRRLSGDTVGVLTSNYDLVFDRLLFDELEHPPAGDAARSASNFKDRVAAAARGLGQQVDFGHVWREIGHGGVVARPSAPHYTLLKLHGSLNACRCPVCEHTYVNADRDIAACVFSWFDDDENKCHCGARMQPTLVAPSFVRTAQDPCLRSAWQTALETLRLADEWLLVGYSFPPEDLAIRSMFSRAWHGRVDTPRVTVVQKSDKEAHRYAAYFNGLDPRQAHRYEFLQGGLESYVQRLSPSGSATAMRG